MKKAIIVLLLVAAIGAGTGAYYKFRSVPEVQVQTAALTRGDIIDAVAATGTLQAVISVAVGSQVSGNIVWLGADFNSIVHKDQVIAKIDPTLFEGQVAQNKANLANNQSQLAKDQVSLAYLKVTLARDEDLRKRGIIAQDALDAAKSAADAMAAQVEVDKSQIQQAEAQLKQSQTNLEHTIISSPIDGIVTQRSVDVGQTVQASMTAPQLYVIAEDLKKMQVSASIDESDVGRVRPGQDVVFRVDAYPGEEFHGTVGQVRLNPTIVNNVTTYATMINVPNEDLRLKPGMTANLKVQVAHKSNVLRVPNTALRFRPSVDVFAALNQPVPPEVQGRGGRGGRGRGGNATATGAPAGAANATAAAPAAGANASARGGGNAAAGGGDAAQNSGDRQQRMMDRFKGMSPDEQRQFIARMVDRGQDATAFEKLMDQSAPKKPAAAPAGTPAFVYKPRYGGEQNNATIDSLFAPVPTVDTAGRVWTFGDHQLKAANVRLGITDGTFTELISGDLTDGAEVVTGVSGLGSTRTTAAGGGGNPLMPQQRGGGPGFGGGPGRGR
ncbi:MAG TPA: efflux RND transporter periplasmic adaptor subunit [Vicinamibacterales bacterium]|nr:efflux RND transporter periplasmic adaptor subunit [Vicinamibacterales bacterium]